MTVAATAAAVGMTVLGTYYFMNKKTRKKSALACKALATALPGFLMLYWLLFVQGAVAADVPAGDAAGSAAVSDAMFSGAAFSGAAFLWTLAAILCYMAADVLLECKFVAGAVCFSAGHLCMIVSFLTEGIPGLYDGKSGQFRPDFRILLFFVLLVVVFIKCAFEAFRKYFPHLKAKGLFAPAIAYITVLSFMAALAAASGVAAVSHTADVFGAAVSQTAGILGAAHTKGLAAVIPAAGGACFVVSDILLGVNRLGKKRSRVRGAVVLVLYYAAVYLFAMRFWGIATLF